MVNAGQLDVRKSGTVKLVLGASRDLTLHFLYKAGNGFLNSGALFLLGLRNH